jgi:hypothetical protein
LRLPLLLLTTLAGAAPSVAQVDDLAPVVLRLPGGTRALGLGNAFAAGRGAEVLFYNPAQMPTLRGSTVSVQRIGSASTLGTFSSIGTLGGVAIGAGVQYLDYETSDSVDWFTPPAMLAFPGPVESASLAATIAAAIRWKGTRIGVGVKYVEEHVGPARDASVAVDIGAARELGRATVALVLQNLGPGLEFEGFGADLPLRLTAALSSAEIRLGTFFDFVAAAAISLERDGRILPGGGAELIFEPVAGWTFRARAGVRRRDKLPLNSTWAPTAGASFGLDRFSLDYGFEPASGPGSTHRLGIRIQ